MGASGERVPDNVATPPGGRSITLLGVPFDAASSFQPGAALGPAAIRAALRRGSTNTWTEDGTDLAAPGVLDDAGDGTPGPGAAGRDAVTAAVAAVLDRGARPLVLGGDHSVTWPVLRAVRDRYPALAVLHLDAHADLYDHLDGDRFTHASPMARVMEEGLADRLVQVGIRTLNRHQRDQAARFGAEVHEVKDWAGPPALRFETPVYVSLDVDVLDPAYAPGVSHPEPGGLSVREVLAVLRRVRGRIVGADLVEFNPRNDQSPVTGLVCAKLVKALVDAMRR
jgi:arginase